MKKPKILVVAILSTVFLLGTCTLIKNMDSNYKSKITKQIIKQ